MELRKEQYEQIKECFLKQRKPVKISNLDVLNAALYVVENGCKWRGLPKGYGDWHVIDVRVNRRAKKGVLQAAFLRLQQLGIIQIQVNVICEHYLKNVQFANEVSEFNGTRALQIVNKRDQSNKKVVLNDTSE